MYHLKISRMRPFCSDISDADDDLLALAAEKIEKEHVRLHNAADKVEKTVRFHKPKTDKEISELQTKQ
jgi:hypothetical protein